MVCQTTLLNSVNRENSVNARMGVSEVIDEVGGIEEPRKVRLVL
jgi:hypothetical protein